MTDQAEALRAYIRRWGRIIIITNVVSIVAMAAIVFAIVRWL